MIWLNTTSMMRIPNLLRLAGTLISLLLVVVVVSTSPWYPEDPGTDPVDPSDELSFPFSSREMDES
jgi:hypothetical protein